MPGFCCGMLVLIAILLPFLMKPTLLVKSLLFNKFGFLTPLALGTPARFFQIREFLPCVSGNRSTEGHQKPASPELATSLLSSSSISPSLSPLSKPLPFLLHPDDLAEQSISGCFPLSPRGSAHLVTVPQFYCGALLPLLASGEPGEQLDRYQGTAAHS